MLRGAPGMQEATPSCSNMMSLTVVLVTLTHMKVVVMCVLVSLQSSRASSLTVKSRLCQIKKTLMEVKTSLHYGNRREL